ncbi:MAG: dockerin type I repeat-containing protein [Prevotella sp.]|nr:dockerin type I repeat-containing protein [Prevotella sp.]
MPIGAWADYELAIQYGTEESNYHSVKVPENTTDVLGDGTITYDDNTHVLTLNGANVTCSYNSYPFIVNNGYWDAEQELTVRLVGSNTITLGDGSSFYEGKGITFMTGEGNSGSLTIIKETGWNGKLFTDGTEEITPTYEDDLAYYPSTSEIKYAKSYSLWICGTQVTDAIKDDILGDGHWSFKQIVGAFTINQLSFNGVSIENYKGNAISSGIDITVVVEGNNTISCADGHYPFYSANGAQFDFDAYSDGTLSGTNRKPFSDNCDYHFGEYGSDPDITGPTLYFTPNGYTIAPGITHWDVSINSNALYSQNYADVFGDGTVSVTDNSATGTFTITLNEANFKGPVCTEAYENVVVNLTGVNYIKNTDSYKKPFSRSYGDDYTLTFTGDGELRIIDANISSADDAFANNTNTFNDIDCSANFTTGGWYKEYVGSTNGSVPYLRIYRTPTIGYNLRINGTEVTNNNCSDILQDAMVGQGVPASFQYIPSLNTLFITNSRNRPTIETWNDEGLTIYLAPNSSNIISDIVYTGNGNAPLTITTDGNNPGKITLSAKDDVIRGFSSLTLEQNLVITDPANRSYDVNNRILETDEATIRVPLRPIIPTTEEEEIIKPRGSELQPEDGSDNINKVVDKILYTLGNVKSSDGDGYDTDNNDNGFIVINSVTTNSQAADAIQNYVPGTEGYLERFKGLTFMIPAGKGIITFDVQTLNGYAMKVMVGDAVPVIVENAEPGTVEIPYNVAEPTYVYVWNAGKSGNANNARSIHKGKMTTVHIKITGVGVKPNQVKSSNSAAEASGGQYSGHTANLEGQEPESEEDIEDSKGDVNGDEAFNVADIVGIANAINGEHSTTYDKRAADVDSNDVINAEDIVRLIEKMIGH